MKKKLNKLPLDGTIVLDLTNVLSGPFATFILAELGASVIKVEKPDGDDSRQYGPFNKGKSCYFISLNRGKKSIVIDLNKKKDKQILEKILKKTDIMIDNYKPGVLEKYGYDWNYLSKKYPRLIHGKISGFGETGPMKDLPAYDIIVQAMGGLMSITGNDKDNLVRVGTSIGDIAAGLFCVIGVLSQLIRRNETNSGSKLDLSMLDCQVAILENAVTRYSITKKNPVPLGTDHPSIAPFGSFKTNDGLIVIAIGNQKIFKEFCLIIKDKEMYTDSKFKSNYNRSMNLKKLRERIEKTLIKENSEYWLKKFLKKNIPSAKINSIEEVIKNKQIINRKMVLDYKEKNLNLIKVVSSPFNFSFIKNKSKDRKIAPSLNENKEDILKFLGIN
ncbi:MAG: hypothetical protein CBC25_00290 [Pelagibacteraceae bacterium TMED65]|nr:carnitine dehydratase [Rickettsiales bacterium]OUU53493.1 MAG: hypothetical protein CBC25_00290 [Pelagibacteraceae bacterium TMED65]